MPRLIAPAPFPFDVPGDRWLPFHNFSVQRSGCQDFVEIMKLLIHIDRIRKLCLHQLGVCLLFFALFHWLGYNSIQSGLN